MLTVFHHLLTFCVFFSARYLQIAKLLSKPLWITLACFSDSFLSRHFAKHGVAMKVL